MKKRKKNHFRFWAIGIVAILLLAAPVLQAEETIPAGQSKDIDYAVDGILWVNGTANFRTGASAPYVYVQDGGTVNMYSGIVDWFINISPIDGGVTIYGTDFIVSNGIIDLDGNWIPDGGMGTLTGKYEDNSDIDLWILSDTTIKLVDIENNNNDDGLIIIDIKPGSDENVINLKSKGVVPVAVLTTDEYNAADLVPDYSISFAGASPVHTTLCDVDGDGNEDMLFHFRIQELDLDETSTIATLTATLNSTVTKSSAATAGDVTKIEGFDKVKIKSSKKK